MPNYYALFLQVRFLDVRNNRLSRLSNLTLSGLQQAEVVDLSNNRIASVQPEAFSGKVTKMISLGAPEQIVHSDCGLG